MSEDKKMYGKGRSEGKDKMYDGAEPLDTNTKKMLKQLGIDPDELEDMYRLRSMGPNNVYLGMPGMSPAGQSPFGAYGQMPFMGAPASYGPMMPGMMPGKNNMYALNRQPGQGQNGTGVSMKYTGQDGAHYAFSVEGKPSAVYGALDSMVGMMYQAMESYDNNTKGGKEGKGNYAGKSYGGKSSYNGKSAYAGKGGKGGYSGGGKK